MFDIERLSFREMISAKSKSICLCFALLSANVAFSDVNVGPFFECDAERKFTAVRPFWSSTPSTEVHIQDSTPDGELTGTLHHAAAAVARSGEPGQ